MTTSPALRPRPHDLLWVSAPTALDGETAVPAWTDTNWPLVVRRAEGGGAGRIAVGLRGRMRHQRHPAWVDARQVQYAVPPEALAASLPARNLVGEKCAVLKALANLAPRLDDIGLAWGPTGSAGFALASGVAVLRPDSDLDLLVRAESRPSAAQIVGLSGLQTRSPCRLDIQIDTGWGGFVLGEWLAQRRKVLLKTARGPALADDPWQFGACDEVGA